METQDIISISKVSTLLIPGLFKQHLISVNCSLFKYHSPTIQGKRNSNLNTLATNENLIEQNVMKT